MNQAEQDGPAENAEQAAQGSSSVARRVSKKPRLGNLSFTRADLLKFRGPRGLVKSVPDASLDEHAARAQEQARTERERYKAKRTERSDLADRKLREYMRLLEPYLGIVDAAKTADREKAEQYARDLEAITGCTIVVPPDWPPKPRHKP